MVTTCIHEESVKFFGGNDDIVVERWVLVVELVKFVGGWSVVSGVVCLGWVKVSRDSVKRFIRRGGLWCVCVVGGVWWGYVRGCGWKKFGGYGSCGRWVWGNSFNVGRVRLGFRSVCWLKWFGDLMREG